MIGTNMSQQEKMKSPHEILTQDKGQLMNQKTSGNDSKKRELLKNSIAATAIAFVAKPFSLFSKNANTRSSSEVKGGDSKLKATLNGNAVARRRG